MFTTYRPILKAKPGEFEAVANFSPEAHRRIEPTYVVGGIRQSRDGGKKKKRIETPIASHLTKIAQGIASTRSGMAVGFDISNVWKPNARTEYGDHILAHLQAAIETAGVKANPVVAYDRWPDHEYRRALQDMHLLNDRHYILRLDGDALEDIADPEYFQAEVNGILDSLRIGPAMCAVIVDLGDLSNESIDELVEKAEIAVVELDQLGFRHIVVAGCSLPPTIDKAIPQPNTSGMVLRREMLLWQTLNQGGNLVAYGDYGVRNPRSPENIPNPNTNAKVRYTTDLNFYIERGHSMKEGLKGEQYRKLAKNVRRSPHFLGGPFSWGDAQIVECA